MTTARNKFINVTVIENDSEPTPLKEPPSPVKRSSGGFTNVVLKPTRIMKETDLKKVKRVSMADERLNLNASVVV